MSTRRTGNSIRGPRSALTDFLAANNISALEIRENYLRRQQAAGQQEATTGSGDNPSQNGNGTEIYRPAGVVNEAASQALRDQLAQQARERLARLDIDPFREEKHWRDRKSRKRKNKGGSDDENDPDFAANRDTPKRPAKNFGQLENCEICDKKFTVTPYNSAGPDGGLLCMACGKEMKSDMKKDAGQKKTQAAGKKRRRIESNKMDGTAVVGAKSLKQLCIEKVAHHHTNVDDLGDLPPKMVRRVSEIFSKHRIMKPRTLDLFVRADRDELIIPDAAYLASDDFKKIFAVMPHVEKLVLVNAGQYKNDVMQYMIEKIFALKHLHLLGANLISNELWDEFFVTHGAKLAVLKLEWLDTSFKDDQLASLVLHCLNLTKLRLQMCPKLTDAGLSRIADMPMLKHLTLELSPTQTIENGTLANIITQIGPSLETLCLDGFRDLDDNILELMRCHCTRLSKLRLANNDTVTDAGLANLFNDWQNEPLRYIDLHSLRHVDNSNPDGPVEPVGLCGTSFEGLMRHSGSQLEVLNIASCRHIPHAVLLKVFAGETEQDSPQYPLLRDIDLSFVNGVDSAILAAVFKSCPAIQRVIAFGCFGIEEVVVPRNVVVIGVPKAQDAIEKHGGQGAAGVDVDAALTAMAELLDMDVNGGDAMEM